MAAVGQELATNPQGPGETLQPGEIRLLLALGFEAVFHGHQKLALPLFQSLARIRPDQSTPRIGLALAMLAAGDRAQAVASLETTQRLWPGDPSAAAFLGLVLHLGGRRAHSQEMLATAEASGDVLARSLARSILDRAADGRELETR